ncbi:MAG: hypothetical protein BRD29_02985, partial [Bacteroidetes bacterium QH_2_67_10]
SRPIEIPGFEFDGERILSSQHALALESVPDSLVVVGAGYIGMELATVFQKVGSDVTVVEQLDGVLPGYADDLTEVVHERAASLGVDFQRRAEGVLRATAQLAGDEVERIRARPIGKVEAPVSVTDASSEAPVEATLRWAWLPEHKAER